MLSGKEFIRYSRQIMLEEHGETGQEKLNAATAVIIGMGGLGCPAAQYLAGAGIGRLILVDDDLVENTNLHRQILYSEDQVGRAKVSAAKERLTQLNRFVEIESQQLRADKQNLPELITQANVVLDCSDNVETRYQINQVAHALRIPLVVGAAIRYEAQIISFDFSQTSLKGCYQCLVPDANDQAFNCASSGVMGPVLGIAGSMQALSAIKAINQKNFVHNLWQCFDGKTQQWISLQHQGAADCPVCRDK